MGNDEWGMMNGELIIDNRKLIVEYCKYGMSGGDPLRTRCEEYSMFNKE